MRAFTKARKTKPTGAGLFTSGLIEAYNAEYDNISRTKTCKRGIHNTVMKLMFGKDGAYRAVYDAFSLDEDPM
jgi:hypothetical protein